MGTKQLGWLVAVVSWGMAAGCDNACGPNMRFIEAAGVCACDDNAIADGGGCSACADDEIVIGTVCGCAPGQAKSDAGVCTQVDGLATACNDTTTCADATYDYCAVRGGLGACTKRCAADSDCPDSYVCANWEATPSCRTYTGYGAACVISDDCDTFDANDCVRGTCVVHGCTVGVDDCPRDTMCCDFSSYGLGTLCAPAASCS